MRHYDKFGISEAGERRRVRLARDAIRLGLVEAQDATAARAPAAQIESDSLSAGREAFARREWEAAADLLLAADAVESLGAGDLERLAEAALWADRHVAGYMSSVPKRLIAVPRSGAGPVVPKAECRHRSDRAAAL
jgi:hypothetical protein